jgi:tetratricopeptide (TPR) repeat protein
MLSLCALLLFTASFAARAGFASLLTTYASRSNDLTAADAAVVINSWDAAAHQMRGAILEGNDEIGEAAFEYARAVTLRPADYVLWMSLAHVRELNGDSEGAIAAARQAVQLAPHYAQPHWQLGNLLVRLGQRDDGFAELRVAATSNPELLPSIIDLAWQLTSGDEQFVRAAIQPKSAEAAGTLADFLIKHEKFPEAVAVISEAGNSLADSHRRYVEQLVNAKQFAAAYSLWSIAHPAGTGSVLNDAGFEQGSDLDEPGFGWRAQKSNGVLLSLDEASPREGKFCLKIEFKGESDQGVAIISQLVMVQPGGHYRLQLAARSEEIVSGGLPGVVVVDVASGKVLGKSGAFPLASNGWKDYQIELTIPDTTSTIQILVQRDGCSKTPCPIFGRLWLDAFVLRRE